MTTTYATGVTPRRVLRSEWHKLWTLRSTWIILATAAVSTLAVGLVMGGTYDGDDSEIDTVTFVLLGTQISQICVAVLAILVSAGEYSTGLIRATLTAVPRRTPVLWAKAAVFTTVALTVTAATNVLTFLAAQLLLADTDKALSLGDPGVLRAVLGNAAGITLLALIALGLGALVRSIPGGIGAFVALVLILPELLSAIPYDGLRDALDHFPAQAAGALGSATPLPDAVSPGPALLALVLWALAVLWPSAALLRRRDV
ncbi:ABC transporter permease [Streptomyces boluensis]|uniref:ABC transporter permease n=1 Tax=Streptomyces boluensis TaxID=1775135 RepID=A0A964XR54_9ACTN|nr:ABC transporter permease [Streptomyces boluensis]NBE56482.1 ABC transporter permease [Streptomyces boluensis]